VKVLYKYRPLGDLPVRADGTTATQAAVQLLTGRMLYAASPSELNDVFELTVRHGETIPEAGSQFIRHAFEQAKQTADLGDGLRTFVDNVLSLPSDQLGPIHEAFLALLEADWRRTRIISLSARCNEHLMWAHYAGSHTGFCVGFRVRPFNMFAEALQVVYHESAPVFTLGTARLEELHEAATLAKSAHWSYEDEWRMIFRHITHEIPKLLPFAAADLAEIIFGLRVHEEAECAVRAASADVPNVKFGRIRTTRSNELEVAWD